MAMLPAARVVRLEAERRLAEKLERDVFAGKVEVFCERVASGHAWKTAAIEVGIRIRTARILMGQQRVQVRIRQLQAELARPPAVTMAELEAAREGPMRMAPVRPEPEAVAPSHAAYRPLFEPTSPGFRERSPWDSVAPIAGIVRLNRRRGPRRRC